MIILYCIVIRALFICKKTKITLSTLPIALANSLDQNETPSDTASRSDQSLHSDNSFTKYRRSTVLVLSKLKKINATAPQPQRTVLKYFALFQNVAHSLEPCETPSNSASHQAPNYVQSS